MPQESPQPSSASDPAPPDAGASLPDAARHGGTDLSVSLGAANLYSLLFVVPAAALLIGAFAWRSGLAPLAHAVRTQPAPIVAGLVLAIVLHELVHGAAWIVAGRVPRSAIRFGISWKALTPYANCTVPLDVSAYRIGAMAPGILIGLLPALAGIAAENGGLFLVGSVMTLAAGGDVLVLWLLRNVPRGAKVLDHPTRAGCIVLPGGRSALTTA